jgi:hypothetical protein
MYVCMYQYVCVYMYVILMAMTITNNMYVVTMYVTWQ